MFDHSDYKYIEDEDYYECPAGNKLIRRSKKPNDKHCYLYRPSSIVCNSECKYRSKCTTTKKDRRPKTLKRHMYHEEIEEQLQKKYGGIWKIMLRKRQHLIEGSFADGKVNHGLGRARYRGIEKVQEQSLMIATVQNIKKYIKELKKIKENISAEINSVLNYSLLIYSI